MFVAALPELIAASIILILGYIVGKLFGGLVRSILDGTGLDNKAGRTPIGDVMGTQSASALLGDIVKWFIYTITILAAANTLNIAILSQWISMALTYLPAFVGGLLMILLGFILADFIGDAIRRTQATTKTAYTKWFAEGVKVFLYFLAIIIGLGTMGIDVTILYIFARALAWGAAIGIALGTALAIGISLGWGSKDYVKNNIEDWMKKAKNKTQE